MRKLALTSAFAAAVALGGTAAHAQVQGFAQGWNEVQVTNCFLTPGTPAAGTVAAKGTELDVSVNIIEGSPDPNGPPPVPDNGKFTITDPTIIDFASPWCKAPGGFFFVYMNGNTPQYLSLYPH